MVNFHHRKSIQKRKLKKKIDSYLFNWPCDHSTWFYQNSNMTSSFELISTDYFLWPTWQALCQCSIFRASLPSSKRQSFAPWNVWNHTDQVTLKNATFTSVRENYFEDYYYHFLMMLGIELKSISLVLDGHARVVGVAAAAPALRREKWSRLTDTSSFLQFWKTVGRRTVIELQGWHLASDDNSNYQDLSALIWPWCMTNLLWE